MRKSKSTLEPVEATLPIADLSDVISKSLSTEFKDLGQVVFSIEDEEDPANISDWISTGNTWLDISISNKIDGGIPVGRLTEISGLESSGKTLLASHILANTQKKNGLAIFIETENSLDSQFLRAIGVDTSKDKFLHINLDTVEDILAAIESIIIKAREKSKDMLISIVVDSIAAASTKTEQEADYEKAGYNTTKAIVLSQGLRKLMPLVAKQRICLVFVNQLRHKMGLMMPGSDPYTTPGGKAVPFHSSVRIRLKVMGKVKMKVDGIDQVIGIKTKAEIVKNKLGPAHRAAEFVIYYDSGIDDMDSILELCKKYGIVLSSGPSNSIVDKSTGEVVKFKSKDWGKVLSENNNALMHQVKKDIAETLIMKYRSEFVNEENTTLDTESPIIEE